MKVKMISVLMLVGGVASAQTNDVVASVQSAVLTVVSSLPSRDASSVDFLRNFGVRTDRLTGYRDLVRIVSQNQDTVCSNFNLCATNEISRMMLLSAWWGGDDVLYMDGLSRCLDMAIAGVLSREDAEWFRNGHHNERRGNILALKYDSPGVSNIVMRLCNYTCDTNACRRILSGEARRSVRGHFDQMTR